MPKQWGKFETQKVLSKIGSFFSFLKRHSKYWENAQSMCKNPFKKLSLPDLT
jgi:hypothetical protein